MGPGDQQKGLTPQGEDRPKKIECVHREIRGEGGVYLNLGQRLVVYVTMGRHIRMLSLFWRSLAQVL